MAERFTYKRGADADLEACDYQPGQWYPWKPAGSPWAIVVCPECGTHGLLDKRWTIAADGSVSPSINCIHKMPDGSECSFHEFVRLEGWEP